MRTTENNKETAIRLAEVLVEKNIDKKTLAAHLSIENVQNVDHWIRRAVPYKWIPKICDFLNLNEDWLLNGKLPKYRTIVVDNNIKSEELITNRNYNIKYPISSLPVVAANKPSLTMATLGLWLDPLTRHLVKEAAMTYIPEVDFLLTKEGDAMEPDIKAGDMLACKLVETIETGKIGIFKVSNDSYIIREVYQDGEELRLRAKNPVYKTRSLSECLPIAIVLSFTRKI